MHRAAAMADIDVVLEDDRWEAAGLEDLAEQAGRATLAWLGMDADIVVMGCDDARIADLNADFRGKPQPTNVLSWPSVEHVEHAPVPIRRAPTQTSWAISLSPLKPAPARRPRRARPLTPMSPIFWSTRSCILRAMII